MVVAFEKGDIPFHFAAEAFVEFGFLRWAGVEYLYLNLSALGEEAEDRGVVLDGVRGYYCELFQLKPSCLVESGHFFISPLRRDGRDEALQKRIVSRFFLIFRSARSNVAFVAS